MTSSTVPSVSIQVVPVSRLKDAAEWVRSQLLFQQKDQNVLFRYIVVGKLVTSGEKDVLYY